MLGDSQSSRTVEKLSTRAQNQAWIPLEIIKKSPDYTVLPLRFPGPLS